MSPAAGVGELKFEYGSLFKKLPEGWLQTLATHRSYIKDERSGRAVAGTACC